MTTATWSVAALAAALLAPAPQEPVHAERVGGFPYQRLATRALTLEAMLDRIAPEAGGRWGEWHLLTAFPYAGHRENDLERALEPESELDRLALDGPGPDFARVYPGKDGSEARWRALGRDVPNHRLDLKIPGGGDLNDFAACYLHTTVTCERDAKLVVEMGSDDGAKVWLNGAVIQSKDVPRGMVPDDDRLQCTFARGVNHFLFKIAQGEGGWDFQITSRRELSADVDAQLYYFLDRDFPPSREREHYRLLVFPVPDSIVLEVGGLAFLGDGTPAVTTRRGDVYLIDGAYEEPPLGARFHRFASGLHEALGCATRRDPDGEAIYAVQRGELTRLVDQDGDRRADLYQTFCDEWGVSGNYHEFGFGPKFDAEGNAWVTLNVGFCGSLGKSIVPLRGACVKIDRAGRLTKVCDGLRSPNGMAAGPDGTWFYVDNQGDWVATNRMSELKPGSWHGHPSSLHWRDDSAEGKQPPRQPPTVWFPYEKMGQSVADLALDTTGGKFGPFAGQFFAGDQLAGTIMRVAIEQVDGHWQGACFPFLSGFGCGVNRLAFAPDGSLFVGETDRGWGSVGRRREGLERVVFGGAAPFEILAVRARPDGFDLEFTEEVDPATAADVQSYAMTSYTYEYHADYGAPEADTLALAIAAATLLDARTVHLSVSPLRPEYVHEIHAAGVRSKAGVPLLHPEAYYTLVHLATR